MPGWDVLYDTCVFHFLQQVPQPASQNRKVVALFIIIQSKKKKKISTGGGKMQSPSSFRKVPQLLHPLTLTAGLLLFSGVPPLQHLLVSHIWFFQILWQASQPASQSHKVETLFTILQINKKNKEKRKRQFPLSFLRVPHHYHSLLWTGSYLWFSDVPHFQHLHEIPNLGNKVRH